MRDDPSGGDVVLTAEQVRGCLHRMSEMTKEGKRLWLTTREMDFALEREDNEVEEARDRKDGRVEADRQETSATGLRVHRMMVPRNGRPRNGQTGSEGRSTANAR